MVMFVRVAAVFIGMANLVAYLLISSSEALVGDDAGEGPGWPYLLLLGLFSVLVGLLTAEILLRLPGPILEGSFLRRYAAAVLGCCVGGVLSVVPWTVVIISYATLTSQEAFSVSTSLALGGYFAVCAGLLGLAEGLFFGVPLAFISGCLRTPG